MKSSALVALSLAVVLAGCTTSSAIMTGTSRPPTSAEQVRVYLRAPSSPYESIALVTATSNAAVSRDGSRARAIEELRVKAAALGANGILLGQMDNDAGPRPGVYIPGATRGAPGFFVGGSGLTVEVQAEAIFVQP